MALLLHPSRLGTALRRPGPSRLRKLAPPAKIVLPWIAGSPVPRAAVSVEAPTAHPTNAAGKRPTLYLLHRHLPRSTDTREGIVISQDQLHQLHDDLKAMEKVAKHAAWFSTVEASDGEHVLLLTDCEKMGRKYGLQAMPADVGSFTLDLPGRSVAVPLEEVSAALLAQKEMESSSDNNESDSDDDVATVDNVYDKDTEKAAKKQRKEAEKAAKAVVKLDKKLSSSKDEEDSDDESKDEEDNKKATKAEKKKEEKKDKEKKDKEEKKKEEKKKEEEKDSDEEESSSSGSDSDEEMMATGDFMEVINKMKEDDSGSESEEGSGSESEEVTMSPPAITVEVVDAIGTEECQSRDEDGSGSESEERGSTSEEEMEVQEMEVVKAVESGETTPQEA
ncbi:hypothetical protein VaNZ11_009172 [Volvox africanus]|uniref:Uncharacterized protein n=1 Tax=Volvox africanus TaxID=51714 RepID=A0ABQ5S6Y0_9CHLO|nr:hypothetical protein VaNZ11_009172 [Volvox africanus]